MPRKPNEPRLTPAQSKIVDAYFIATIRHSHKWANHHLWDADECESRACKALMQAAVKFEESQGVSFWTFLLHTVRLEMQGWRSNTRRRIQRRPAHEDVDAGKTEIVDRRRGHVDEIESAQEVHRMLYELPARQRECLLLRADGWHVPEIAKDLGLTEGETKRAIESARRTLRKIA